MAKHAPGKLCKQCGKDMTGMLMYGRRVYCGIDCTFAGRKFSPEKALARFMSRVEKRESGCWVYKGATDKWGYTHLGVNGRRHQAHRFFYEQANGKIPAGKIVLHTCDTPPCVNPEHMRIGTHADNHADMVSKGRHAKGAQTKRAVLNEDQVREIRRLRATGMPYQKIGAVIGCSYSTARYAVVEYWKHVK